MQGRPTDYSEEIVVKAKAYLDSCVDEEIEKGTEQKPIYQVKVKLPSIAGLALHLGIARSTVYEWKKEHKAFSDILDDILSQQEKVLLENGLSGTYNPTITKLVLGKHGYTDKQDVTSDGKQLPQPLLANVLSNDIATEDSSTDKED